MSNLLSDQLPNSSPVTNLSQLYIILLHETSILYIHLCIDLIILVCKPQIIAINVVTESRIGFDYAKVNRLFSKTNCHQLTDYSNLCTFCPVVVVKWKWWLFYVSGGWHQPLSTTVGTSPITVHIV